MATSPYSAGPPLPSYTAPPRIRMPYGIVSLGTRTYQAGREPACARRRFASCSTSSGSGPLRAAAILSCKCPTSLVPTIVVSRSGLERVKRNMNSMRLMPLTNSSKCASCQRSRIVFRGIIRYARPSQSVGAPRATPPRMTIPAPAAAARQRFAGLVWLAATWR